MSETVYIKQRDTARDITDTLELPVGTPIDLTGATIVMVWKNQDTGVVSRKTTVAVTTAPGADGGVTYTPAAADVEKKGTFDFEWEVTLGSGKIITVPTRGSHTLIIEDDLDD